MIFKLTEKVKGEVVSSLILYTVVLLSRILSELEKLCKGIPHAKTDVRQDVIMEGEVAFTNNILALGYDLVIYGNGNEWNYKKNLCVPYFNYKHP